MSASSPLVGITLGRQKPGTEASFLRVRPSYPQAVAAAGGAPALIPMQIGPEALRQTYERLDVLLLWASQALDRSPNRCVQVVLHVGKPMHQP